MPLISCKLDLLSIVCCFYGKLWKSVSYFPFINQWQLFGLLNLKSLNSFILFFARNFYLTHTYRIAASKRVGIFQPFVSLEYFCKFTCSYRKLDKTPISRITDLLCIFILLKLFKNILTFLCQLVFLLLFCILILVLKVTLPTSQIMQEFHRK